LIVAGDINIHLDEITDLKTIEFIETLDSHGLMLHVTGDTHRAGHCLDVLITRRELCVRSVDVDPLTFSDYSTIVAQVDLQVPQDHTTEWRVQRCWRQFDLDRFIHDLELLYATQLMMITSTTCSTATTTRYANSSTFRHQQERCVYELLGRLLGMTLTAVKQKSKHVVWKNCIVLRRQLVTACNEPQSRLSASVFPTETH